MVRFSDEWLSSQPLHLDQHCQLRRERSHLPTAFSPFVYHCPAAAESELGAILQAKEKVKKALPLAKNAGAGQAFKLAKRAKDTLSPIGGGFTFYSYMMFADLPSLVHDSRMDLEQASQNCHTVAAGSDCGRLFACAADDLLTYDPHPNIHPMDRRISLMVPVVPPPPHLTFADDRIARRQQQTPYSTEDRRLPLGRRRRNAVADFLACDVALAVRDT
eukprot:TRINITY_DN45209_c0_g1_i1.p1 TRINITY_DN45209_c0_g1~~TRINITY_DN45209_c0_g1_i1.p1  ORF type:complete len:218 (-),score=27.17 TRINITY_DN45209_c0_g1_i1:71-724(-)